MQSEQSEPACWKDGLGALSRYLFELLPRAPADVQRTLGFRGSLYAAMARADWTRARLLHLLGGLETRHGAVAVGGPAHSPLSGLLTAPAARLGVAMPPPAPLADMPAAVATVSGGITFLELPQEIGFGSCRALLAELKAAKAVDLRIDSIGGDIRTALEIGEELARKQVSVATASTALSAAAVILQGARTRRMLADGRILIHAPRNGLIGTSAECRQAATELECCLPRTLQLFSRSPRRTIIHWMRSERDYWFTPEEAKRVGLIDQILPAPGRSGLLPAAGATNDPDSEAVALAVDLLSRLEGACKDRAHFRAELARRLGAS
jgi:ATP-dependent protease ClpP protease subunit